MIAPLRIRTVGTHKSCAIRDLRCPLKGARSCCHREHLRAGSPAACLLSSARSLQALLEAGGPLASALSPLTLPASGAFTLPQAPPLNLFSASADRGVRSPSRARLMSCRPCSSLLWFAPC